MKILSLIIKELVGMFIDDGALALLSVLLIVAVTVVVRFASLPPLFGGVALLIGCLAILFESVRRATRSR